MMQLAIGYHRHTFTCPSSQSYCSRWIPTARNNCFHEQCTAATTSLTTGRNQEAAAEWRWRWLTTYCIFWLAQQALPHSHYEAMFSCGSWWILFWGNYIVIHSSLHRELLGKLHGGHQGITKCEERVRQSTQQKKTGNFLNCVTWKFDRKSGISGNSTLFFLCHLVAWHLERSGMTSTKLYRMLQSPKAESTGRQNKQCAQSITASWTATTTSVRWKYILHISCLGIRISYIVTNTMDHLS